MKKSTLILLFMMAFSWQACDPDEEAEVKPQIKFQSDKFFISLIVGEDTDLGVIINDPVSGLQYAAFGPKGVNGYINSLLLVIVTDPVTEDWVAHEFEEDYTPSKTTTSTGHEVEYTDIDETTKTGSVRVSEIKTGRIVWEAKKNRFNDLFFDNINAARELSEDIQKNRPVTTADLAYVLTSAAGCAMGIASLSSGPLAAAWGAYNTYQSCKSTIEAVKNLSNNKPAYGCMKTSDHVNIVSNFGATVAKGGSLGDVATGLVPAVINYGTQSSGDKSCEDKENGELPRSDSDGWFGSIWGDPHLSTPDGLLYDFHGYGEFIFTKSLQDNFEVQVRLGNPYSTTLQATLTTAVAVQTGSDIICIIEKPLSLYINNVPHDFDFDEKSLTGHAAIKNETDGNYKNIIIRSNSGDFVKVRVGGASYMDVKLSLSEKRKGTIQGLMGNNDGDQGNDLQLKNGERVGKTFSSLYPKFADSWRVEQQKSLFYYQQGTNTETFTKMDFPKAPVKIPADKEIWAENICRQAGLNEEPFLNHCTFDVAVTDDPALAYSGVWAGQNEVQNSLPPMDLSNIELQGNATIINDKYIRLTENKLFLSGQAFHNQPMTGNFETEFTFKIGISNNGGGDGFAFLIAKDIPLLKGNPYPGGEGKLGYEGVMASLAVEFDTKSEAYSYENGNHMAIHTNGKEANSTGKDTRIAYNKDIIPLQDGLFHIGKIKYHNKNLTVYLDGLEVMAVDVDLIEKLGLDNRFYIGFTSSTGQFSGAHSIYSWKIN